MSEMLEEIAEQPAALEKIFNTEKKRIPALRRIASRRRLRLIVLAARGTSDNAALFGRYLLEFTTGIPVGATIVLRLILPTGTTGTRPRTRAALWGALPLAALRQLGQGCFRRGELCKQDGRHFRGFIIDVCHKYKCVHRDSVPCLRRPAPVCRPCGHCRNSFHLTRSLSQSRRLRHPTFSATSMRTLR